VRMIRTAAAFLVVTMVAAPAFAQGSYIGAFLVADVVRLDKYDSTAGDNGNGEALGFALRLGTPIRARWGVELEFVRPGEITTDQPQILPLPAYYTITAERAVPGLPNVSPDASLVLPSYSFRFRSTQRRSTLSTALWVQQEISRRFSLAYVGGLAFGRTDAEVEVDYLPIRPTILPIPRSRSESISYDIGPTVGVEGRIGMADQLDLVPSLRLHGFQGGWLIRPSLGLAWNF
jgi:hypothetical protein